MLQHNEYQIQRIVVQPGRTLRSGRRGRWFESSQSDHKKPPFMGVFLWSQIRALEPARAGSTTSGRQTERCR